jgi:hypothetical protein
MTKPRDPLTYERALTVIAALIGWDVAAATCGVAPRTLRKFSEPDLEREISLVDAERLDRAFIDRGGDHAPFHRTFALRLGLAEPEPITCGEVLARTAARVAKESGDATAALINAAARPGCRMARRKARKETREAIEALGSAEAALGEDGEA